ncbi:MAG: VTT domain-containing protein [Gemmatimonadota bacterium]|nr:VTT domain-containing protein [Gemmatimonadota bacterium]
MNRRRILFAVLMLVACVAIVSTTLGREVYSGRQPGLASFTIVHFAGYLFFLLMPVEALLPYYMAEGHRGEVLIVLAVITALVAQVIDYGIGRLLAERVARDIVGQKRYARLRRWVDRWGSAAIFVFNLFPLSSPNMLLVAGMTRFGVVRTFGYSALGLLLKYVGLVYIFDATGWFTRGSP